MPLDSPMLGLSVNPVCCNGCGACAEVAPELFRMNSDTEKAELLADSGPEEIVRKAIAYCPHDCIEADE